MMSDVRRDGVSFASYQTSRPAVLAVAEPDLPRPGVDREVAVVGPGAHQVRHLCPALDGAVLLNREVDRAALLPEVLLVEAEVVRVEQLPAEKGRARLVRHRGSLARLGDTSGGPL